MQKGEFQGHTHEVTEAAVRVTQATSLKHEMVPLEGFQVFLSLKKELIRDTVQQKILFQGGIWLGREVQLLGGQPHRGMQSHGREGTLMGKVRKPKARD